MKNNTWKFNAIIFYDCYVRNITKECETYNDFVAYVLKTIAHEINVPFPNMPQAMYVSNDHSKKYYSIYFDYVYLFACSADMPIIKVRRENYEVCIQ